MANGKNGNGGNGYGLGSMAFQLAQLLALVAVLYAVLKPLYDRLDQLRGDIEKIEVLVYGDEGYAVLKDRVKVLQVAMVKHEEDQQALAKVYFDHLLSVGATSAGEKPK